MVRKWSSAMFSTIMLVGCLACGILAAPQQGKPLKPPGPAIGGRYGGGSRPIPNTPSEYPKSGCDPANFGGIQDTRPPAYDFGNPDPNPAGFGRPAGYDFGNPDPNPGFNNQPDKPIIPINPANPVNPDNDSPDAYDFGNRNPPPEPGYKPVIDPDEGAHPTFHGGEGNKPAPVPTNHHGHHEMGEGIVEPQPEPDKKTPFGGDGYVPPADDPSAGEDYDTSGGNGKEIAPNTEDSSYGGHEGGNSGEIANTDCTCVPWYQCKDGNIITDGSGLLDPRKKSHSKKEIPLEEEFQPPQCGQYHVCCSAPSERTESPYEHFCGIRKPSGINKKILSANQRGESEFGEWPWQGAVLKVEGETKHFQCGAVLIDEYHAVTAAHCINKFLKQSPLPLVVRFGEWDTQTMSEFLPHEDYSVDYVHIHPEFRNASLWNDVAVLKLSQAVKYGPHIDSICLPNYGESHEGEKCVVTGWGKNAFRGGTYSNVLREVHVPVISNRQCQDLLRKTRLGKFFRLHDGFMCAGGLGDQDSCKGDGGGPLTCYRSDGTYSLVGIVSWGIECGKAHVPGVYMDMSKYLDWIKDVTQQPLEKFWSKQ